MLKLNFGMNPELHEALRKPEIDQILLQAVSHADFTMRKYVWRGFRPEWKSNEQLMVGGDSADDFVQKALAKLIAGERTYDSSKTLLQNLKSITDSLIWSAKKSSDRTGVVDYKDEVNEEGLPVDPISLAKTTELNPTEVALTDEIHSAQQECVKMLKASFDGDKEMQEYIEALSEGFFKPSDIADLTGIPVATVYELRRKMSKYAPLFFGAKNFKEFHHKLSGGSK